MSTFKRRKLAIIDIGSNSALLLIAERSEEGVITVLKEASSVPRLGAGIRENRKITDASMEKLHSCVADFFGTIKEHQCEEVFLTLTAAAREAENQAELIASLKEAIDVEPEILSQSDEARFAYFSVTSENPEEVPCMVVDIGGGSTEVTWGLGNRFDGGRSLNLGTVKLLEGPLQSEKPSPEDLNQARKEIDKQLARIVPLTKLDFYYGTAGSFTHLAALDLEVENYHPTKVDLHPLTRSKVSEWVDRLSKMSHEEMLTLKGIDPARVDLLLSGTLIIERLFEKFKNEEFLVMDRGIRFGKLFNQLRKFVPPVKFATG